MSGNSEAAKKFAARMLKENPNYFRELNKKSREAWEKGGRKSQGFKTLSPEQVKEISRMGLDARWGK